MSDKDLQEEGPPDFDVLVGQRIKTLRKARLMSQSQLVEGLEMLGFSLPQQTVARIEGGTRALRFSEAKAIADVLDVSMQLLLMEESPAMEERLIEEADYGSLKKAVDASLAGLRDVEMRSSDWTASHLAYAEAYADLDQDQNFHDYVSQRQADLESMMDRLRGRMVYVEELITERLYPKWNETWHGKDPF